MRFLEKDIDGLLPLKEQGLALYPESQLERIFDWADERGKRIVWIDAIRNDPFGTLPSMENPRDIIVVTDYLLFRATCLNAAQAWTDNSRSHGMRAHFEIGSLD